MCEDLTDPEDVKLATLARASRARARSTAGAAVRDTDGRTYAAASVGLASLELSALQVAVAMALSSGARDLEAAVVVAGVPTIDPAEIALVREVSGGGVRIAYADPSGTVVNLVTT